MAISHSKACAVAVPSKTILLKRVLARSVVHNFRRMNMADLKPREPGYIVCKEGWYEWNGKGKHEEEAFAGVRASIHTFFATFDDEEWRIITLFVNHLDSKTKYIDLFAASCGSIGDFTDIKLRDEGYAMTRQMKHFNFPVRNFDGTFYALFCCERLSASMARSLHLSFICIPQSTRALDQGGVEPRQAVSPKALRPWTIPLRYSVG